MLYSRMGEIIMKRRIISTLMAILLVMTVIVPEIKSTVTVNASNVSNIGNDDNPILVDGHGTGDLELSDKEQQWLEDNQIKNEDQKTDASSNEGYPDSVDNSKNKYFPAIGNQGQIGSCTGWSMVYYQMTYMVNRMLDRSANQQSNILSPKWSYNLTNNGVDRGAVFSDVLKVLQTTGAADMQKVPVGNYNLDSTFITTWHPTESIWKNAQQSKLDGYSMVNIPYGNTPITSPDDTDLDEIKKYLSEGEILTFSTDFSARNTENIVANSNVPENNKYLNEQIISRYRAGGGSSGHRMTIVGYNDNIWVDINQDGMVQEGEKGAFKIANSWGSSWGNNGFIWLSYDTLNRVSSVNNSTTSGYTGTVSLNNIVRYIVKKPSALSGMYAKITMNSAVRNTVRVSISETTENGSKKQWNAIPFYGRNAKACSFDGTSLEHDGTFILDLGNVDSTVSATDLEKNVWEITVTDTSKDNKPLVVKQVQLIDDKNNIIYDGDLAGNKTVDGDSVIVSFNKAIGNTTTIYYRGYSNPKIHYKVGNVAWTTVPGVSMDATNEMNGYSYKKVIALGNETVVTACFNNGNGKWDSKEGANYQFGVGVYGYSDGCVETISGQDYTNYITTIYYSGFSNPFIHYKVGNGSWTNPPGFTMNSSAEMSGFSHKKIINLGKEKTLTACFNNGNGTWDNNGGRDYTFGYGTYTFRNGTITKVNQ